MIDEIKQELFILQDEKYRLFSSSLLPHVHNVLGVRLPELKKIAKKIVKENYIAFLKENDDEFFELTMLEAFVIGFLEINFDKKLLLISNFLPKITNWSLCDSLCSSLKDVKNHKEEMKNFLEKIFFYKDEFYLRFCYVILLNYYINSDFEYVINKISQFNSDKYYAKMGAAWCLSYCLIKKFDDTFSILPDLNIPCDVYNKAIQKACESFCLSDYQKRNVKKLKK